MWWCVFVSLCKLMNAHYCPPETILHFPVCVSHPGLPLSALRLLVPPLQLLSAAMWQVAKQKDVMNYEKLQEFVFKVTEAVPGLINHKQRAQLILGLRARVSRTHSLCLIQIRSFCCYILNLLIFQLILELCKGSAQGSVDSQVIQSYLNRLPLTSTNTGVSTLN